MSSIKVSYCVNEAVVRSQIIATGHAESQVRSVIVDLTTIDPDLRRQVMDLASSGPGGEYWVNLYRVDFGNHFMVDHDLTVDEIPVVAAQVAEAREAAREAKAASEAESRAKIEANQAEVARRNEQASARIEAEKEARRIAEADKQIWVSKFGSEHLRRAVAAGYDSQRKYVIERAARDLPGFIADFNDSADWKPRSFPSVAALDTIDDARVRGFEALVVWLTAPASAEIDERIDQEFEPCEAVVVKDFLDRYDLVRIVA